MQIHNDLLMVVIRLAMLSLDRRGQITLFQRQNINSKYHEFLVKNIYMYAVSKKYSIVATHIFIHPHPSRCVHVAPLKQKYCSFDSGTIQIAFSVAFLFNVTKRLCCSLCTSTVPLQFPFMQSISTTSQLNCSPLS